MHVPTYGGGESNFCIQCIASLFVGLFPRQRVHILIGLNFYAGTLNTTCSTCRVYYGYAKLGPMSTGLYMRRTYWFRVFKSRHHHGRTTWYSDKSLIRVARPDPLKDGKWISHEPGLGVRESDSPLADLGVTTAGQAIFPLLVPGLGKAHKFDGGDQFCKKSEPDIKINWDYVISPCQSARQSAVAWQGQFCNVSRGGVPLVGGSVHPRVDI